jgi:hypothetical protein
MKVAYKEILTEILKRTFPITRIEIPTNYVHDPTIKCKFSRNSVRSVGDRITVESEFSYNLQL